MIPKALTRLGEAVLEGCRREGVSLAVAESCTGGLIAGCLTAVPGSSDVFDRGFVTYTNEAKSEMLGVPEDVLVAHGAVSEETARAMAEGVLENASAQVSVAVTGIAGPGGATADKPVGLVEIAAARAGRPTLHRRCVFSGSRALVRELAVEAALELVLQQVDGAPASRRAAAGQPALRGGDVALVFAGILACLVLVAVAVSVGVAVSPGFEDFLVEPSLTVVVTAILGQTAILAGCIYGLGLRRRRVSWPAIGFRATSWGWAALAVVLGVVLVFVLQAIDRAVDSPLPRLVQETIAPEGFSWAGLLTMIAVAGIIAPAAEEMLFRGVLYGWLRRRWGPLAAIILSSLAFGAAHINPYWAAYVAVVGVVLAVIYEKSGSLWPPILLHMSYNSVSVITLYLSIR